MGSYTTRYTSSPQPVGGLVTAFPNPGHRAPPAAQLSHPTAACATVTSPSSARIASLRSRTSSRTRRRRILVDSGDAFRRGGVKGVCVGRGRRWRHGYGGSTMCLNSVEHCLFYRGHWELVPPLDSVLPYVESTCTEVSAALDDYLSPNLCTSTISQRQPRPLFPTPLYYSVNLLTSIQHPSAFCLKASRPRLAHQHGGRLHPLCRRNPGRASHHVAHAEQGRSPAATAAAYCILAHTYHKAVARYP